MSLAAFPSPGVVVDDYATHRQQGAYEGMTLRDYFAAKAMQACLARGDDTNRPGIAEWAYCMADAMLKAREASHA